MHDPERYHVSSCTNDQYSIKSSLAPSSSHIQANCNSHDRNPFFTLSQNNQLNKLEGVKYHDGSEECSFGEYLNQIYCCLTETKDPLYSLIHDEFCSNFKCSEKYIAKRPLKFVEGIQRCPFNRVRAVHRGSRSQSANGNQKRRERFKPLQKPLKIFQVDNLQDDFYLKLLDWSCSGLLAVGSETEVCIWNPENVLWEENLLVNEETSSKALGLPQSATRLSLTSEDINEISVARDLLVTSVSWENSQSPRLAVGCRSGAVVIWDVIAEVPLRIYREHQHRVGSLDWCGPLLTSGSRDKSIISRDLRAPGQGCIRWEAHKQEVCGISWSPQGCGVEGTLASGGNDNVVYVWKLGYDKPVLKLKEHTAAVKALAWSPYHPGVLATGGGTNDRCIRLWDVRVAAQNDHVEPSRCDWPSRASMLSFVESGSQICNVVWSKTSQQLLTTHGFTLNQMILWDVCSTSDQEDLNSASFRNFDSLILRKVDTFEGHSSRVLFLAMNPGGDVVATAAGDETVRFWNLFPQEKRRSPEISPNIDLNEAYFTRVGLYGHTNNLIY